MNNRISMVIGFADTYFLTQETIGPDDVRRCMTEVVEPLLGTLFAGMERSAIEEILMQRYCGEEEAARILEGRERREPWLDDFKATTDCQWQFWKDYRKYLFTVKHMSVPVLEELDRLTDVTLDRLFDPRRQNIHLHKKGMVVGQVQSGKTSNYTALICKAADAGFDMIIVLAGILNNLRSQTQLRLDEGFLGFDTQYERAYRLNNSSNLGVGEARISECHPCAQSLTTSRDDGDFKKRTAEGLGLNFRTHEPILMVVKKNKYVLENLADWITSKIAPEDVTGIKSVLVIDDEADHASVNTSKTAFASTINACIRSLLGKFHKVGYVGYTATPFANIFIPLNETDLFPRDFIINLAAPSNYIGPKQVFGINGEEGDKVLPIVSKIKDYQEFVPTRHKRYDPLPTYADMPESLKVAIKSFILTCAIRKARGQENEHNSMLIHLSRYQCWQEAIKEIVGRQFRYYKEQLDYGDEEIYEELKDLYENGSEWGRGYKDVTDSFLESGLVNDPLITPHTWEEVRPHLRAAANKIKVKSINGSSADVLEYYEYRRTGLSVIVIGGDKLSRGLTLEGLSVSYFLRASKMYDTLMQMGRWFGYRPGYADLCRLFTSAELNEWYRHITTASEELREEFNHLCAVGATPDQYGLQVRSHPGCLQITAANKMRYVRNMQVSWSARIVESTAIPLDTNVLHTNYKAADKLITAMGTAAERKNANYLWRNVDTQKILEFLRAFTVAGSLKTVDTDLISKYIDKLNDSDELNHWNVCLVSKQGAGFPHTFGNGMEVGCPIRRKADDTGAGTYCIRNSRIISPEDELTDISEQMRAEAMERTRTLYSQQGREWTYAYPSPKVVREEYRSPKEPLLILYPLDPNGAGAELDYPIMGFAISFPKTRTSNHEIKYVANLVDDFAATEDQFESDNDNTYDD